MTERYSSGRPFRLYNSDKLKIYSLGSERFKTNYIVVSLIDPMHSYTAAANALIARMLKRGCSSHPKAQDLQRALEELYGAVLSVSVDKKGIYQCVNIAIGFVAERYIDEEIVKKVIKLISEIIFEPALEDDIFPIDEVEQEKQNLIDAIRARKNDKNYYAIERCEEELFKGEEKGLYYLGDEGSVAEIDAETLTVLHKRLLSTADICIFLAGEYSEEDMQCVVDEFESRIGKQPEKSGEKEMSAAVVSALPNEGQELQSTVEKMDVLQGKMAIGFKTDILPNAPGYVALMLANTIMGGGLSSKMFNIIREQHNLAYYASSHLMKFQCGIIATCGIDCANRTKTRELVLDILKQIQTGDFTDKDLENAKKTLINSYRSLDDSQISAIVFNFGQLLVDSNLSSAELIELIQQTEKDEVVEAAGHIYPNNEFFIATRDYEEEEVRA